MLRKIISLLLCFSFILSHAEAAYAYVYTTQYLCDMGLKFYRLGRYHEAREEFEKALLVQPGYEPAIKYLRELEQLQVPEQRSVSVLQAPLAEEERDGLKREAITNVLDLMENSPENPPLISPEVQDYPQQAIQKYPIITHQPAVRASAPLSTTPPETEENRLYKKQSFPYAPSEAVGHAAVPSARAVQMPAQTSELSSLPPSLSVPTPVEPYPSKKKTAIAPQYIPLTDELNRINQPVNIEMGKSLIISGKNIYRFLITQPGVISAERLSPDQIRITGADIGFTYGHFWDDNGRWTVDFLTILPKPEGPTVEELFMQQQENQGNFKVTYDMSWNSFESGRRLNSLKRQSYSWYHDIGLTGSTPYGDLDSSVVVRSLKTTTDVTYFTVGLSKGLFECFKDFNLRIFDFSPNFSDLAFSSATNLRGIKLESPAFHEKLDYTVFWGREGGGRYGNLSPGLQDIKDSYINGYHGTYHFNKNLDVSLTFMRGYGADRSDTLPDNTYAGEINWRVGGWDLGYQAGYNGNSMANVLTGTYTKPNFNFNYELRDIDKTYQDITGQAYRVGEFGGLFNFTWMPNSKWSIFNRLDIYRDRLFPAEDNEERWNQDYDLNAIYSLNPNTSLRFYYTLQNDLGKLSQYRYTSPGLGISHNFNFIRPGSLYLDYRHQDNTNYTAHSMDYFNENLSGGIRFNLAGQLYYFLNKQFNWLQEKESGFRSNPNVMETGLDFSSRVFDTPLNTTLRLTYRNEEDTGSALSFLSGEDSLEGYAELNWWTSPVSELYCSIRVRNIWAEKPEIQKRIEADFNAGMRYTWDTGIRWDPLGSIEGDVFMDMNGDGIRNAGESPVKGIQIVMGSHKAVTDASGHYKLPPVRARKAVVALDLGTLPSGYVLTVPQRFEVRINQRQAARVDFGIISRSEISGTVFVDVNSDGVFNQGDDPVSDVAVLLENGKKTVSGQDGRYIFSNITAGKHTLTLDLKSLPIEYLPKVAISKEVNVTEGITYRYDFPLRMVKDQRK